MLALNNDSCQSVLYTRGKNLSVISRGFEAIVQYCVNDRAGNENARSMQANCSDLRAINLGYGDSRHMAFSALSNEYRPFHVRVCMISLIVDVLICFCVLFIYT